MGKYYRYQKRGLQFPPVRSSRTSLSESLPKGFVFACTSENELGAALLEDPYSQRYPLELIVFEGTDPYDPGDVCGVAVKPTGKIYRRTAIRWIDGKIVREKQV